MRMRKVVMFFEGRLFPNRGGTARVVLDLARILQARPDINLTLVVLDGRMAPEDVEKCRGLCHEFIRLAPASPWSLTGMLNALARRLGSDVRAAYFRARAVRAQMTKICADADLVLVNSTVWYPILPRSVRRQKATVITHDVLFQRHASFRGHGLWSWLCARTECRVLKTFRRVAVFADYEREILVKAGVDAARIVCIGLPVICPPPPDVPKKFDFLILGAGVRQNEEAVVCFFTRVVPLLGPRRISLAVVGGICQSDVWSRVTVPANVEVIRLGMVDDLASACASARIGVSTPSHGSGVKVKTVECIEYGLPMVVTDCGEEGVPVTAEGTVNIDQLPSDEVAQRIGAWLDDPKAAAEAGRVQAEKVRAAFGPSRLEVLFE